MKHLALVLLSIFLFSCGQEEKQEILAEKEVQKEITMEADTTLKQFFDKYNFEGSFLICDLKKDEFLYSYHNKERNETRFSPASTFKILNSLIALEEGVAPGPNFVLKWDGKKRWLDAWNKDHDLQTAFSNSVVWYYQELARRIEKDTYLDYFEKINFGNNKIGEKVDEFWLDASLQISPVEQMSFLKKLYKRELPFSKSTYSTMKMIMHFDQGKDYSIGAKTGSSDIDSCGWFVGIVESKKSDYAFVTTIKSSEMSPEFFKARIAVTLDILRHYKIIPEEK